MMNLSLVFERANPLNEKHLDGVFRSAVT